MKLTATLLLLLIGLFPAFMQTTKPLPGQPSRSTRAVSAAARPTPKPTRKPKAANTKPAATSTSAKPKPKPAGTPKPKVDEATAWAKIDQTTDAEAKLGLLTKFVTTFSKSERLGEARKMIVETEVTLGDAAFQVGSTPDGAQHLHPDPWRRDE